MIDQPGFADFTLMNSPFPAAVVDRAGAVVHRNRQWQDVSTGAHGAAQALTIDEHDWAGVAQAITTTIDQGVATWVDVEAHSLAERRWARCHVWPAEPNDAEHANLAVVALREPRDLSLTLAQVDHVEAILEHTADAITIVDADFSLRYASGIATNFLGATGSQNEGESALSFVAVEDHESVIKAFAQCVENPRLSVKTRFRAMHEQGHQIWVEAIGTNLFDDPAINGILVTLNDITELVQARTSAEEIKAALESEKRRYEMLAQFTPTGLFEITTEGQVTYRNERFDDIVGLASNDEFSWDLIDERDRDELQRRLLDTSTHPSEVTVRLAADNDEHKWVKIRVAREHGGRILASIEDNTSEVAKQAELAHRADHDVLTGLPNREHLLESLEELTAAGEPIAVLFVDLDNFKDINDGLGHQVGDQVLVEISDRIQSVVRPDDVVGRLHGDEFLIVCRKTADHATAFEIAARLVDAVSAPLDSGQGLMVSGSVGIALSGGTAGELANADQLLIDADVAMYEAKRRGGSRSVVFTEDLGKRAADRLRLHGEMQRAGELDELAIHYQPIIDLYTGSPARLEALLRWQHPTQGFILPGRFIPDIEKSELIDELGMWVLERVIRDLALEGADALPVNVNVSPHQLADPTFADATLKLLASYGVEGTKLTVEMTELIMMDDFGPVEAQLRALRDQGVGVAVDDFGTGFSALAYLHRFPFDQIKIDGLFIDRVDKRPSDRAIVSAVIELAASLGADSIAEKVERREQVDVLVELGCAYAQGFLLGKPEPRE